MIIRRIVLAILIISPVTVAAQLGGSSTYSFLNLTNSARVAAMGGKVVAVYDDDLNLPFHNPSLLNPAMSKHLVLNYVNYFTDINYGYISYAENFEKIGTFAAGIHYINYGDFIAADRYGTITGNFTASEYTLNLMYARQIDSLFSIGINLKPIYSVLETYRSYGMAADIGVTYVSRDRLFATGLTLRNLGAQIRPYYGINKEALPLRVEFGVSQKLEHAPFRFSLVAHNLQKYDLTYKTLNTVSDTDPLTGELIKENKIEAFGDKAMRHMIFGIEFMPFDALHVRFGYNYLRRQELKLDTRLAMVGFSWGFGIQISGFQMSYGRASYHLAGSTNHFSLTTNFSSLIRKK